MEVSMTYNWQEYFTGKYRTISSDVEAIVVDITEPTEFGEELNSNNKWFFRQYTSVKIPKENYNLLLALLRREGFESLIGQFLGLGCLLQMEYSENSNVEMNSLLSDFNSEKESFVVLLGVLEDYLFSSTKHHLNSVSFKFKRAQTVTVDNFIVVNEIYKAICEGFGLTKDNFQSKKSELLSKTNQFKVEKYDEKVKTEFIQEFYKYLQQKRTGHKKADSLKFTGAFLHIFQIPTNSTLTDIELYDDITEFLKSFDLRNLEHYLSRPPKTSH